MANAVGRLRAGRTGCYRHKEDLQRRGRSGGLWWVTVSPLLVWSIVEQTRWMVRASRCGY